MPSVIVKTLPRLRAPNARTAPDRFF